MNGVKYMVIFEIFVQIFLSTSCIFHFIQQFEILSVQFQCCARQNNTMIKIKYCENVIIYSIDHFKYILRKLSKNIEFFICPDMATFISRIFSQYISSNFKRIERKNLRRILNSLIKSCLKFCKLYVSQIVISIFDTQIVYFLKTDIYSSSCGAKNVQLLKNNNNSDINIHLHII